MEAPVHTYLEVRREKEREIQRKRWSYGWSPSQKKAFIVDGQGYTIVGPTMSAQAAAVLVAAHNRSIEA